MLPLDLLGGHALDESGGQVGAVRGGLPHGLYGVEAEGAIRPQPGELGAQAGFVLEHEDVVGRELPMQEAQPVGRVQAR